MKQLRKLGAEGGKRIFAYLDSNITDSKIHDQELEVLVVKAGHRCDVYDGSLSTQPNQPITFQK